MKETNSGLAILVLGILSLTCTGSAFILLIIGSSTEQLYKGFLIIYFSLLAVSVVLAIIAIVSGSRFRKKNGYSTGKTGVGMGLSIAALIPIGIVVSVYIILAIKMYADRM